MPRTRSLSRLQAAGLSRGDKILIWGENRPEWIVAFWGAVLSGVAVVPIDFRASADFLLKVRSVVDARIVLVGDDVSCRRPRTASRSGVSTNSPRVTRMPRRHRL